MSDGVYAPDGSYNVTIKGGTTSGTSLPTSISQTTPGTTNGVVAKPTPLTTATNATVASSASSVTLIASNASRKPGSIVVNDSTAILYINLGSIASTSAFVYAIDAKSTVPGVYYVPDGWTDSVTGIWASATGNARVTEMA